MDKKSIKRDGRAWGLRNITVTNIDYLSPNYTINTYSNNELTEHGLLVVAELKPNDLNLPKFVFRWDEKQETLDVDVYVNDKPKKRLWNKGYAGHHTQRVVSKKGRVFYAKIKSPKEDIFKGLIQVQIKRALLLEEKISIDCKITGF